MHVFTLRRPRIRRSVVVAFVVGLLVAAPVATLAMHRFADVPDDHPFHNNISAIANAGITTGCGGGNYCPDVAVDRGQMAAFMQRGFGRVARHAVVVPSATLTTTFATVNSVDITPGGLGAGTNGFVQADGIVQFRTADASGCPCTLETLARVAGGGDLVARTSIVTVPASAGVTWTTAPITGAGAVTPGTKIIQVVARLVSGTGNWAVQGSELIATYLPFGATGGSTLDTGADNPATGPGAAP